MSNITLETSNFSEQLGIYDFFNVIISGAVFIFSLCAINSNLYTYLFNDIKIVKGLGIVLLIYVIGLILQEIAHIVDKRTFDIYKTMNRSIIKDTFDENGKRKLSNEIIDNPLLIEHYRKLADSVLYDLDGVNKMSDLAKYNNEEVNGFFFSVCQYYVAVNGKDGKIEKMRALSNMSKILMVCFGILAIITVFAFQPDSKLGSVLNDMQGYIVKTDFWNVSKDKINNISPIEFREILKFILKNVCPTKKKVTVGIFMGISYVFYKRTKRVMRYFLLILLGTYDALIRLENKEKQSEGGRIGADITNGKTASVQMNGTRNNEKKSHTSLTHTREQLSRETGVSTANIAKYDVVMKSDDE